jgi:hypothetical protein
MNFTFPRAIGCNRGVDDNENGAETAKFLGRSAGAVGKRLTDIRKEGRAIPVKARNKTLPAEGYGKGTICWECKRAGSMRRVKPCPWVLDFAPVAGWTATKTALGYCVLSCPLFLGRGEKKEKKSGI